MYREGLPGRQHPSRLAVRSGLIAVLIGFLLAAGACAKKDEKPSEKAELNSPAPQFVLSDLKGAQVKLDGYKGKVVMVEFFATWCAPCQLAAPDLQALYEKYKEKGFVVLGVTIEGKQEEALNSFIAQYRITFPVLIDDGKASRQYEVFSIPISYLIDRQGVIISKHMGFNPGLVQSLSSEIEARL